MKTGIRTMIIVNFAHPITDSQKKRAEELAGQTGDRVIDVTTQFDEVGAFSTQARALVDAVGLSTVDWQTRPLLVGLPSMNVIAALVLAEIHGRSGHFPAVIRMRPVPGALVRQFEVAEILDLQTLRDKAREVRKEE